MSSPILVVANAHAGSCRPEAVGEVVRRLEDAGRVVTLKATQSAGEATAVVAAFSGETVVACGGDGTVHSVLQGLDLERQALGIVPLGSGNDIYRSLGQATDIASALKPILAGTTAHWDFGEVDGLRFLNSAGVGIDSETLATRERSKGWIRKNYVALFLKTLISLTPIPVRLTIDGTVHEEAGYWYIIANGPWIGGGMEVAPGASVADGRFEIVCVGNVGKVNLLRALPKIFKGTHIHMRGIRLLHGRSVRLECRDHPRAIAVDGELAMPTPVTLTLRAGALRIYKAL